MKQMQMKENKDIQRQIKGEVKLTRKVVIPPLYTISVSGLTKINKHTKRVNIITEPREDGDEFTVPCYSYMRPGSKRAAVTLRNLSEKPQVLKKRTVIVKIQPAYLIPPKLAPRFINSNSNNANQSSEPTPERSEGNRLKLRQLFIEHHHIFALDDLELGRTDMVKHVIRLNDDQPFREHYRRIPPHQYDEVKKHLKEMLEIGAIRKSQSPWASTVVLVRKKDGALHFCTDLQKLNARTIKDA